MLNYADGPVYSIHCISVFPKARFLRALILTGSGCGDNMPLINYCVM